MAGFQKVIITGNLGADPEMRYTANGTAVATFGVAVNRVYNDASGQKREEVTWFNVVAWQRLAETCATYLSKGREVLVEGRIATRKWDKPDGGKGYAWELVASEVRFLGSGQGGGPKPDELRGSGQYDRGGHLAAEARSQGAVDLTGGDIDPDDLPF
jgi:single-strand DNA-binding protein